MGGELIFKEWVEAWEKEKRNKLLVVCLCCNESCNRIYSMLYSSKAQTGADSYTADVITDYKYFSQEAACLSPLGLL